MMTYQIETRPADHPAVAFSDDMGTNEVIIRFGLRITGKYEAGLDSSAQPWFQYENRAACSREAQRDFADLVRSGEYHVGDRCTTGHFLPEIFAENVCRAAEHVRLAFERKTTESDGPFHNDEAWLAAVRTDGPQDEFRILEQDRSWNLAFFPITDLTWTNITWRGLDLLVTAQFANDPHLPMGKP